MRSGPHRQRSRLTGPLGTSTAALFLVGVAACSSTGTGQGRDESPPSTPSLGLAHLQAGAAAPKNQGPGSHADSPADPNALADLADQADAALKAWRDQQPLTTADTPRADGASPNILAASDATPDTPADSPAAAEALSGDDDRGDLSAEALASGPGAEGPLGAGAGPAVSGWKDHAGALIELLVDRAMLADRPAADSMGVALLEAIAASVGEPGSPSRYADLEPLLSDQERRTIAELGGLVRSLAGAEPPSSSLSVGAADAAPGSVTPAPDAADLVRAAADRLAGAEPLRVTELALCSRVAGFGRFDPVQTDRFVAGRPHRLIVYAEVDRFAQRPLSGGAERWEVELGQEIELYHDADGVRALYRPEQAVRDRSRNPRRDFFLWQELDLPPTLSIGAYRLKVTMRDKVSGAVAERTIPIRVVAEQSAAR